VGFSFGCHTDKIFHGPDTPQARWAGNLARRIRPELLERDSLLPHTAFRPNGNRCAVQATKDEGAPYGES
jgi:hypothetical protein